MPYHLLCSWPGLLHHGDQVQLYRVEGGKKDGREKGRGWRVESVSKVKVVSKEGKWEEERGEKKWEGGVQGGGGRGGE